MTSLLVLALAAQAVAMLIDEAGFHRARGLPRWERVGHPLDTMTVVVCQAWVVFVAPTPRARIAYVALAAFSSLFVTKDEFVHASRCRGGEHWLHALLFVLHPVVFLCLGIAWPAVHPASRAIQSPLTLIVTAQLALTFAFGLYQAAYWNLPWTRRESRDDV